MNKKWIEIWKLREGVIRKNNEKLKLSKGFFIIFKSKVEILLVTCENGSNLFDSCIAENDTKVGRFFRIYIFLFGMIYNKNNIIKGD